MNPTTEPDTFVFAPFMLEQIERLKNDEVKLAMYRAICHYGCYGEFESKIINEADTTGALEGMLNGMFKAIDKAKAQRKRNQQNGSKGGAPKGSRNNPGGRKGKITNPELTETNPELTEINQELNYNDYMVNVSMDNDLMNLPRKKEFVVVDNRRAKEEIFTVRDFTKIWDQLPQKFQNGRAAQRNEKGKRQRREKIKNWIMETGAGLSVEEAKAKIIQLINKYPNSQEAEEKPDFLTHIDQFLKFNGITTPKENFNL